MARTKSQPVKRSVLRVIVLNVVSLGLYTFYWFYIVRKQLNEELGQKASLANVDPLLQAIGPTLLGIIGAILIIVLIGLLVIPIAFILGIITWYYLLKDINQVRETQKQETTPPALYILGYAGLTLISPANLGMIGLPAYYLNEYWDKKTKGAATEAPYTSGEIAVSVAGIALFIIAIVGFFALAVLGAIVG